MDKDPIIREYQIEVRGRIKGTHAPFGIKTMPVENSWNTFRRYDVIASSYDEAIDMVREFENSGGRHDLVRRTMERA